jgi:hypothetical protein
MLGLAARLLKTRILQSGRPLAIRTLIIFAASMLLVIAFDNTSRADPGAEVEVFAAWGKIVEVLRHPRCLNCHQLEHPLQGDSRRMHIPPVVPGPDNFGAGTMRCYNCHNDRNNEMARVPGAPKWSLAPANMLWEGKSSAELCELLKMQSLYQSAIPEAIIEHMAEEHLVLWGWDPGPGRTPVSIPHDEFVRLVKVWVTAGLPCPKS